MTTDDATRVKTEENRLRRMAARQGLRLRKSPRRDPHALGAGTYRIETPTGAIVIGDAETYGLDAEAVEAWLTTRREDRP